MSQPLITDDGGSKSQPRGILGSREELAKIGVEVLRDYEAVERVRGRIAIRDKNARYMSERTDLPLPEWVGKD